MPPRSNPFFLHRPDGSGVSDPGYRRKPGYKKTPAPSFHISVFIPSLPEVAGMVFLFRRLRLFFPPAIGSDPP